MVLNVFLEGVIDIEQFLRYLTAMNSMLKLETVRSVYSILDKFWNQDKRCRRRKRPKHDGRVTTS
jgi:hypothetical protein